jgi:outer membrane lipoprotein carrier protein
MWLTLRYVVVMVSLSWTGSVVAITEIEQSLDTMTSFEAEFVQLVHDEKVFREEKSSGRIWVQRPGKFFWRYEQAAQKMDIVADGINLWIYQPDLKQVMVQPLAEIADDLPISWLASGQPLAQRFNVRPLPDKSDGLLWFDLQNQKGGSQEIAFIEIGLQGEHMKEVRLTGSDGKVTRVTFHQAKRNEPIASQQFQFNPAVGIDIIGNPQ